MKRNPNRTRVEALLEYYVREEYLDQMEDLCWALRTVSTLESVVEVRQFSEELEQTAAAIGQNLQKLRHILGNGHWEETTRSRLEQWLLEVFHVRS